MKYDTRDMKSLAKFSINYYKMYSVIFIAICILKFWCKNLRVYEIKNVTDNQ